MPSDPRPQFSLLGLMLFTTLAAVGCALVKYLVLPNWSALVAISGPFVGLAATGLGLAWMANAAADARGVRRGISLLEVTFAIAVLLVGFLGLMSLLPVAAHNMSGATTHDAAATLGRAALADIEVRGMSKPSSWAAPQAPPAFSWILAADGTFAIDPATGKQFQPPFTIDPLHVSRNLGAQPMSFPASSLAGAPTLRRLTVATKAPATGNPVAMRGLVADSIFQGQDDMVFDLPSDPTKRPIAPNGMRAQAAGNFSWFAVVDCPYVADPAGVLRPNGLWQTSIVVVRKRDFQPSTGPGMTPAERSVLLDLPANSGGDGILRSASADRLAVKPNQWVLVLLPMNDPSLPAGTRLKPLWQRIGGLGDVETTATGFARRVTLAGSDLPPAVDHGGNVLWQDQDTSNSLPTTWCIVVDGVSQVYERALE